MTQRAELAHERLNSSEWPAYQRPAGRTWQMNPVRRGIYENPLAEAQGEWKADLILNAISPDTAVRFLGGYSLMILAK